MNTGTGSGGRRPGHFACYAVNVCDLMRFARPDALLTDRMVMTLLRPLLTRRVVECEGERWDGDSLLVREDIPQERVQAVLTVLRTRLGVERTGLRIYGAASAGSRSWTRLTCQEEAGEADEEDD